MSLVLSSLQPSRKDYRATASYGDLWRQAGCPRNWPKPLPVYVGASDSHRYMYSTIKTTRFVYTLPSGSSALFLPSFWENEHLIRIFDSATTTTAIPFDKINAVVDKDYAAGLVAGVPPLFATATDYLQDTTSRKTGTVYNVKPSVGAGNNMLSQLIGGNLDFEIVCPWDGAYTVMKMCAGNSPAHLGTKHQHHEFDVASNVPYNVAIPAGLKGKFRTLYGVTANMTPLNAGIKFGKFSLHSGGNSSARTVMSIPLVPETGWAFQGVLDAADAPTTGVTSVTENFRPRNNIAFMMQYGGLVVENSGPTTISITGNGNFTMAHVLTEDDQSTNTPALVSQLRLECATLALNPSNTCSRAQLSEGPDSLSCQRHQLQLTKDAGASPQAILETRAHLSNNVTAPGITPATNHQSFLDKAESLLDKAISKGAQAYGTYQGAKAAAMQRFEQQPLMITQGEYRGRQSTSVEEMD